MADAPPDTLQDTKKPSLESLAKKRLPIIIPWHAEKAVYPGQLFHSRLAQTGDPWSAASPFITSEVEARGEYRRSEIVYLSADGGTSGSYREAKTQTTTVKQEHESYGFTAAVELGICKASASLEYDKHLTTNEDDIKISCHSSYRCGTVLLRQAPALTDMAQIELKYKGGIDTFERKYGDYYLWGFNLGGDNAMMVSTNSKSMSMQDRKTLTAKLETFLFDFEFTEHWDSAASSASASLRTNGYDTLMATAINDEQQWSASNTAEFDRMHRETSRMRTLGSMLPTRVEQKAAEFGLLLGPAGMIEQRFSTDPAKRNNSAFPPPAALEMRVDKALCDELIKSCLVVELVLMPVRSIRQIQEWIVEDDII